jgi:flap endonuclease-1
MFIDLFVANKEIINKTDVLIEEPDKNKIIYVWLNYIKRFLNKFLMNNITPVIVIDGIHPDEKEITHQERRLKKEVITKKIEDIKEKIQKKNAIDYTNKDLEELRKYMSQVIPFTSNDIDIFVKFITSIGLPFLKASNEGEQLCSYLCKEKLVDAVYSTDRDCLVYGTPILITKISENNIADIILLDELLAKSELDFVQFVDMCILAGCDFNTNIRNVGIMKSYKLIKQYKSIDNLPTNYDISCLNHEFCRDHFKYKMSHQSCLNEINLRIQRHLISKDELSKYGLLDWLSELNMYYDSIDSNKNNQPININIDLITENTVQIVKHNNSIYIGLSEININDLIDMQCAQYLENS